MKRLFQTICLGLTVGTGASLAAQTLPLAEDRAELRLDLNGQDVTIQRQQDVAAQFAARPPRVWNCPPDCIQPMIAAPGVVTLGELETASFLESFVDEGQGLLFDSRPPGDFSEGTIPGAVNVPAPAVSPDNPYLRDILLALGAKDQGGTLNFADALEITVFCEGPSSDQAIETIEGLLRAGYPAEKLNYYRGGILGWQSLGLTVSVPQSDG